MKTCPICKARCFDDMEICYGCMHHFAEEPAMPVADDAQQRDAPESPDAAIGFESAPAQETPSAHSAAEAPHRHAPARKDAPHVFGAVDDEGEDYGAAGASASPYFADGPCAPASTSLVMLATGPLAQVSLGNGYRLVVSVEPE